MSKLVKKNWKVFVSSSKNYDSKIQHANCDQNQMFQICVKKQEQQEIMP